MGDVINLSERRDALRGGRGPRERSHAEFFFDLACPFTYLAAERVDRAFDEVIWTPAAGVAPRHLESARAVELRRRAAEQDAAALRLPLVWPEPHAPAVPVAMRVATFAAETGHGYEFALAASRLAFAGGYHLDDPAILADAASAAGLHAGWMHAARDAARDELVAAAGERLAAVGADRMPALALRRALVWGEARVNDALSSARPARAVGMS